MLNPMNLVTETVFQGFHDRDDPGIIMHRYLLTVY